MNSVADKKRKSENLRFSLRKTLEGSGLATCPKCENELKEDFGLETCSKCGSVVFVVDDEVKIQDDEESVVVDDNESVSVSASAVSDATPALEKSSETKHNDDLQDLFSDNVSEDLASDLIIDSGSSSSTEDYIDEVNLNLQGEGNLESVEESNVEALFDDPEDFLDHKNPELENLLPEELSSEQDSVSEVADPTSADDFLKEMQLFGELDSEKFKGAGYYFDLEIASIDSKETRIEVLSSLDDQKLSLDLKNADQRIKNGVLLLKAIPAVKAYIIVQRISHLPCELSWTLVEAHDLTGEQENTDEELLDDGSLGSKSDAIDVEEDF